MTKHRLKTISLITLATLIGTAALVFILLNFTIVGIIFRESFYPNYAEEVAKPIEKALVAGQD